jgi:hypothetical protein
VILLDPKVELRWPRFDLEMAGGENLWLDLVLKGGRRRGLFFTGESSRCAAQCLIVDLISNSQFKLNSHLDTAKGVVLILL